MEHILSLLENGLRYAVPFLIVLGVVVTVHEFGHYWVARLCGVKIDVFSIGFGKTIWKRTDRAGTEWKLCWIPLGGYVKMYGDADATSARPDEAVKTMTDAEKKLSYFYQPVKNRMAIAVAGPFFNYAFAVLVMAVLFMVAGQPVTPPLVDTLMEDGAAGKAGLLIGDRIVSIDGKTIDRFEDIKRVVAMNAGEAMTVVVDRAGEEKTFAVTPIVTETKDRFGNVHKTGRIGVTSKTVEYVKHGPFKSILIGAQETIEITSNTLKGVGQMIMGMRGSEELGGPLRIAEMSGTVARDGVQALVWFIAVISINLGLINLFPIPLLDGGNLAFYIIEWVRGRPLSEKLQDIGFNVGALLVLSLMLFATWNDLVHLRVVTAIRDLF